MMAVASPRIAAELWKNKDVGRERGEEVNPAKRNVLVLSPLDEKPISVRVKGGCEDLPFHRWFSEREVL